MNVKEFHIFSVTPEVALTLLTDQIKSFIRENNITIITSSHSIMQVAGGKLTENFMASALICYKTEFDA